MSAHRKTIGAILLAAGLIGLIVSFLSLNAWGFPAWPYGRGGMPMWGQWNQATLAEVNGTVQKIEWMEIELNANGSEVEVHGPSWFWQRINLTVGDLVEAEGVFVSMMEHMSGFHQELVPFEITVNGITYGNASERIPVWMQSL